MSAEPSFSLLGCGRAGAALGRALLAAGWRLRAVECRSPDSSLAACRLLGAGEPRRSLGELLADAELLLIATPDRSIAAAARALAQAGPPTGLVALHLAGSLAADVLAPLATLGVATGACHPLLSLADRDTPPERLRDAWFAVDGKARALERAHRLVAAVGGHCLELPASGRTLYHAGASLASNALVTLTAVACELFERAGVEHQQALPALLPLLQSTLGNLAALGPAEALTGPVRRGDATTVRAHLLALPPELRASYASLARHSLELARQAGLDETSAGAVEVVLAELA